MPTDVVPELDASALDQQLQKLLEAVPDFAAIVVNDKDGVLVAQAFASDLEADAIDPWFSSTFSFANEQADKLQLGENLSIITEFDNMSIYHANLDPLVLSIIVKAKGNVGLVDSLLPSLKAHFEPLRARLQIQFAK